MEKIIPRKYFSTQEEETRVKRSSAFEKPGPGRWGGTGGHYYE